MQLKNIGEFGLIDQLISPHFKELIKGDVKGIGDDCAVLPMDAHTLQVVTTDMLVEDVHFLRKQMAPYNLGFKSLAVNLSDIAAMGAWPTGSFLSVAFPEHLELEWITEFIKGYKSLSSEEETPLLGGDTTKSPGSIIINVTVTGLVEKERIKYRSTARPGDIICVPDYLGDSAGGFQIILNNHPIDAAARQLLKQHNKPAPKISEARFLSQFDAVHAMLDISDGINSDLRHILKASNVGATIQMEHIPASKALASASKQHGWNIPELTLSGGEDYSLLITIAPHQYEAIARAFEEKFKRPLHAIGKIDAGEPEIRYFKEGIPADPLKSGYRHF